MSGLVQSIRKVGDKLVASFKGGESTNIADNFEEGTWSPSVSVTVNLTGTASFSGAVYTRVGNTVFVGLGQISGLSVTATDVNTVVSLNTDGLPGVTNSTVFYGGGGFTRAGGSKPVNASIAASGSGNDRADLHWTSSGTGSVLLLSFGFWYYAV
jgi:hypothetical protein